MGSHVIDRVPPQNSDAERSVLGAMMQGDKTAIAQAIKVLGDGEGFYRERHGKIYAACVRLFEHGEPVDLMTVTQALEKMDDLEKVGGVGYIDELIDSCPTSANVEHYARMVYEEDLRRKLILAGARMSNDAFDKTEEVTDILMRAQRELLGIGNDSYKDQLVPVKAHIKEMFQKLDDLYKNGNGTIGLPTGFLDLDKTTSGFQKGDYIIVAGRPSMGKSTFIQNVAQYLCFEHKDTCAIFSLEMSRQQVLLRILSSEAGVSLERMRTGKLKESDWPKVTMAASRISEGMMILDDDTSNTPMKIRAKCYTIGAQYGLDMVMIDHVQLLRNEKRIENRNQELTEISFGLKALARDLQVPVVVVSQLSRDVDKRSNKRPQLSDLRESGSLEQDADLVLFLYRPDYYDRTIQDGITELIIGKQRNGPVGTIDLIFDRTNAKFQSRSYRYDEDVANRGSFGYGIDRG